MSEDSTRYVCFGACIAYKHLAIDSFSKVRSTFKCPQHKTEVTTFRCVQQITLYDNTVRLIKKATNDE